MNNEPTPNDLCECGHDYNNHIGPITKQLTCCQHSFPPRPCKCLSFKPATPQPNPVPVSEADVERVTQAMDDYSTTGDTPRDMDIIECCARYHLEHLHPLQKERDELRQRVKELEDNQWQTRQVTNCLSWLKSCINKEQEQQIESLRAELDTLKADKEKLKEALNNYGKHKHR